MHGMQRKRAHLEVHHVWMPQDDVVLNLEANILDQHLLAAQDRFNGDVGAGSQVAAVVHLPEGTCASMEAGNRADIKAVSLHSMPTPTRAVPDRSRQAQCSHLWTTAAPSDIAGDPLTDQTYAICVHCRRGTVRMSEDSMIHMRTYAICCCAIRMKTGSKQHQRGRRRLNTGFLKRGPRTPGACAKRDIPCQLISVYTHP